MTSFSILVCVYPIELHFWADVFRADHLGLN